MCDCRVSMGNNQHEASKGVTVGSPWGVISWECTFAGYVFWTTQMFRLCWLISLCIPMSFKDLSWQGILNVKFQCCVVHEEVNSRHICPLTAVTRSLSTVFNFMAILTLMLIAYLCASPSPERNQSLLKYPKVRVKSEVSFWLALPWS